MRHQESVSGNVSALGNVQKHSLYRKDVSKMSSDSLHKRVVQAALSSLGGQRNSVNMLYGETPSVFSSYKPSNSKTRMP
jgi:hypothetical protein